MNAVDKPLDADELTRLRWRMKLACDMSQEVERLRALGYSDRAILVGFERVRPRGNSLEGGAITTPPLIRRSPPSLRKVDDARLDLYTLEAFLSPQECERSIALIGHHQQSQTGWFTESGNDALW